MNDLNEGWRRRLVICLGFGLILACLCNGAGFYLKKVGVLDHDLYQAYWSIHCSGTGPASAGASNPCAAGHPSRQLMPSDVAIESRSAAHLYQANSALLAFKLVKDALFLALIAISITLVARRWMPFPGVGANAPALLLLALMAAGFIHSLQSRGGLFALLGLRSFMFLVIAVTAAWLAKELPELTRYVFALLALQLLMLPIEFAWGMHIHGHFPGTLWPTRLSGTLILPNSMGIFAVIALAFVHAFMPQRRHIPLLHGVVAVLVVASGSATGCITLIVFWGVLALSNLKPEARLRGCLLLLAACILTFAWLPDLIGRPDLFNSVFGPRGRLSAFITLVNASTMSELMWGSGIGSATNTAINAHSNGLTPATGVASELLYPRDSTVTSLLAQLGLAGVAAFYAMLLVASWRQPPARIFYLVVAISSLTISIPELFPVNLLLGMVLASQPQSMKA